MTPADSESNIVLTSKEYDVIGSRPVRPDGADKMQEA